MEQKEKDAMIDFMCETIRFVKSMQKSSLALFDETYKKRTDSALNRMKKKIQGIQEVLNVECIDFLGSPFSVEIPVEALNAEDFGENDVLVICETIEPTVKEKDSSNIIRNGKVLVKAIN